MSTRTPMSRTEFFKFNPRWNDKDKAILEEDLEQFGGVSFEHSASGYPHVWVMDAKGDLLMHVAKGTVYYQGGRTRSGSVPYAPDTENSDHMYRLSTHQAGGGPGAPEPEPLHPLCGTCFLHHPEGACDR